MEMNFLWVVLALIVSRTVAGPTVPVRLEFLKGITRLDTLGYTDFYFFCGVRGQFLLWKLNNEPLTGFEVNHEVGRTLVSQRSNYVYTATLLSSEPAENGNRVMDSIIVVSFRSSDPLRFEMTCSNGSLSETAMNGPVTPAINSSNGNNVAIVLDYISSRAIVGDRHIHIFICGADYSSQVLQANGLPLAFRSVEALGINRVASASRYTIIEQGILVAKEPVQIVSILIVAQNADVEVICGNGNVQTRLTSNMTLDEVLRSTTQAVAEKSTKSATSSPANQELNPTEPRTTTASYPQDNTDGKSSKMKKNLKLVYVVTAISIISTVVVLSTIIFLGVIFLWCYKAIKNKHMNKVIDRGLPYNNEYSLQIKQESIKQNEENQAGCRHMSSRKTTSSSKKMRPSVKAFSFSRNSFVMLFKLQAQADEIEVKPSQIEAVHGGGSQFAGITTGRSMKQVYVKSDGETFESTEKSVVAREDNPSSYWKVIGRLLKGLFSKYYTMMKFDSLKVRRSMVDCDVAQVQEEGSQMAMLSGKLLRPFYIKSDGQTIAPITTRSLTRQTSQQTEDDIFPKEDDQCRRRNNAKYRSERVPRSVALTRGFSQLSLKSSLSDSEAQYVKPPDN